MNKPIPYLMFFLILIQFHTAFAENPCNIMSPQGGDKQWGSGALYLPGNLKLSLYSTPAGEKQGELIYQDGFVKFRSPDSGKETSGWKDQTWIGGYVLAFLKAKTCSNPDYYQVFEKTVPSGLYVKKSELEEVGIQYFTYHDLLSGKNLPARINEFRIWANIGVNLSKSCLNLREEPSSSSNKKSCVPGNDWETSEFSHMKILGWNGVWAKVEVTTEIQDWENDESGDGCVFKVKEKQRGWVKAIDDSGFPNIWFSVTSY